ncbi:hypothetical protein [Nocardioides sp.]|jgi:hypothetical protein|uniref:hypothetical protein n=1 Tax=Nocardioides sp. TaxID=35761 RepID=UPI002F3E78C1
MNRSALILLAGIVGLGLVVGGGASAAPSAKPSAAGHHAAVRRHHPAPSHFTHGVVDNRWFPLKPGNRYVYRGAEEGKRERDVLVVTYRTRVVDGVVCRVVFDRVWKNGRLNEHTHDFYAQTRSGTVWYFGERTATLDRHGHVNSREGSWMSGVHGAEAGIFMTPHPHRGPSYHQEDFPGHAEDVYTVVRRDARVTVPMLQTNHAVLTRETTVLEPGVRDHKYYVRDIGTVREVTVQGGSESLRLVSLTHRPR